jgi:DNA-binding NtrC family response regulator
MTTVLVVEDTPEIAMFLEMQLASAGLDVRTHTHDFDVLLYPEPWEGIDVLLCDLMLPGVSGQQILAYAADVHPTIRRFAMTAAVNVVPEVHGLVETTFVKPFPTDDLMKALEA